MAPVIFLVSKGHRNGAPVARVTQDRHGTSDNLRVAIKRRVMFLRCLAIPVILLTGPVVSALQICQPSTSSGPVQAPVFVTNLAGQTSWFASPVVYDLDGNGSNELVAAYYDIYVLEIGARHHYHYPGQRRCQASSTSFSRSGLIPVRSSDCSSAGRVRCQFNVSRDVVARLRNVSPEATA
jgi:hypothetical protein